MWHIKTFFIKPIALYHYISFRVINQQTVLRKILFVVKYVYQATNSVELLDNVYVMLHVYFVSIYSESPILLDMPKNLGIYQLPMMITNYLKISYYVMDIISILYYGLMVYILNIINERDLRKCQFLRISAFVFRTCFRSNRNE